MSAVFGVGEECDECVCYEDGSRVLTKGREMIFERRNMHCEYTVLVLALFRRGCLFLLLHAPRLLLVW